jgi:hypothetical protein
MYPFRGPIGQVGGKDHPRRAARVDYLPEGFLPVLPAAWPAEKPSL